jgi:hypothetical protein
MWSRLKSVLSNPTVQKGAIVAASTAAGAYGGPAASAAVAEYLPQIAKYLGF